MYNIRRISFNKGVKKIGINIRDLKRLIMIMFKYSAIKMRAKVAPLYSVLKPLTNSDSPSAKSKGVRFVSANVVVNQTRNRGINIKITGAKHS